jgi:hypothetical protein
MTVRELLAELQRLPRDLEVLAFEAGCEEYCEREVDELELQGGRVYLHLGVRLDDPPRGSAVGGHPRRGPAGGLRRPRCGSGGRSAPAMSRAR